ncbi:ABC-three component system middle component 6 [Methanosarcina mazei]|uniref:ABC-three component system middle component 6 n=1 Tax=Methanosarcina mazei TaxID=2209 RepID=UPI00064E5C38|nr:ABC-three component system middle component 6 [Methanosarcina mazei]
MLKPDKHTNPKLSVINITGIVIENLIENEIMSYDELLNKLISETSENVKDMFVYSLCFLHLLN